MSQGSGTPLTEEAQMEIEVRPLLHIFRILAKGHPYIKIFFQGIKICNHHVMHYIGYIEVFLRI